MRLKVRDLIGAVLVVAIAVPYIGYLLNGEMPFIKDPRGMSATGLVLGTAAYLVMRRGDATDRAGKLEIALAVATGIFGLIVLALAETAAAEALLAVFMVAILAVFLVELFDHAGAVAAHRTVTHA
jgi:hypothetical protein